jgi:hypothetical protein
MPPRLSRAQTQSRERHRTWGTRFDTLVVSPPPSKTSPLPSPVSTSPPPKDPSLVHTLGRTHSDATIRPSEKRDWADDEVPAILNASPRPSPRTAVSSSLAGGTQRKDGSKMPHNASVFVGRSVLFLPFEPLIIAQLLRRYSSHSLPPDAEEGFLRERLAQHLAPYAIIKDVKVIRDTKGGLCAFVQCEVSIR